MAEDYRLGYVRLTDTDRMVVRFYPGGEHGGHRRGCPVAKGE